MGFCYSRFVVRVCLAIAFLFLISASAVEAQIPDVSLAEIAQESDLIFVGTATGSESQFNENGNLIYTTTTFENEQVVYDEGSEQGGQGTIEVVYAGGEVNIEAAQGSLRVAGAPSFETGKKYLMMKRDDGDRYFSPILGRSNGLFQIIEDSGTGTEYVLSASGEAVLSASAQRVITSDRKLESIQNGDPIYADTEQEDFRETQLPTPENPDHSVQLYETSHPSTGVPMTLPEFIDFIQTTALEVTVEDPGFRFEEEDGQGSIVEYQDGQLVERPFPEAKTLGSGDASGKASIRDQLNQAADRIEQGPGNQAGPQAQNLRACGKQNLKITMEHHQGYKAWNNQAMGIWDRFMNIYNTKSDDGKFGRNGENEFIGIVSQSTMRGAYNGFKWDGALAVTKLWYFGLGSCPKIKQTDVALNSAFNWSNSLGPSIDTKGTYSYRATMMHELGHTWGHQTFIDEKYNYDEPSVMHAGYDSAMVEDGWGIHAPDARYLRNTYSGDASVKNINDVGVESYYADEGLNATVTQDASGSKTSEFYPGQVMKIKGLTVENMSNSSVPIILRFYLSKDRTITSADHQIGSFNWSSFGSENFQESDYTVTVPFDIRGNTGKYYVGARVIIPGMQDDFTKNNSTFIYKPITLRAALTIQGNVSTGSRLSSGVEGIEISGFPQGQTVKTDEDGDYEGAVPYNFSGTLDPLSTVFDFTPKTKSFSNITSDQVQDFSATRQTATISGRVTNANTGAGMQGVTIAGLPGPPTTNSTGDYSVTVDEGFDYTATPRKKGFNFSPPSKTFLGIDTDETQDFEGSEAAVANSPWPQFQKGAQRTGRLAGYGITAAGNVISDATGADVQSSPVIGPSGNIYVGSDDAYLYAYSSDLTPQWKWRADDKIRTTPAVAAGEIIYVGSDDKNLYAINPNTEQPSWTFETQGAVRGSPVIGPDGTIYVGSDDDTLYAINPDGTQKWSFGTNGDVAPPALSPDSSTVYVGSGDHTFYAVDTSGTQSWTYSAGSTISSAPAVASDGNVYFADEGGTLYALKPDGTKRWTYSAGGSMGTVTASPALGLDQNIFVGSHDDKLYSIDSSGTQHWAYSTNGDINSSPAVHRYEGLNNDFGEVVYVGSDDNSVYAVQGVTTSSYEPSSGTKVWSHGTGNDVISSPALTKRHVYIGSNDRKIYKLGIESDSRTGRLQVVGAAMAPTPEEIFVMMRMAEIGRKFADSALEEGGGCEGGPLIIPACGGPTGRFGGAIGYERVFAGQPVRFGAIDGARYRENPGVIDQILAGEETDALLGDFVTQFEPDKNYMAVLSGVSAPEQYPSNPNGRSTALDLHVKEQALPESPDPEKVQVTAGHFVPDAPGLTIDIRGREETRSFGTLRYGDMSAEAFGGGAAPGYMALDPGRYTVVLTMESTFQFSQTAKEAKRDQTVTTTYSYPLNLTGKAGDTVSLLANGLLSGDGSDDPAMSIRSVSSDGEMADLGNLEGTLAPGLESVPGLLEDELLLEPEETETVFFEQATSFASNPSSPATLVQLLPTITSRAGYLKTPVEVDLPAPYEISGSALAFLADDRQWEMTGVSMSEMPEAMQTVLDEYESLTASYLSKLEISSSEGTFRYWLAMEERNGYAIPAVALYQFETTEGETGIRAAYLPEQMSLDETPLPGDSFTFAFGVRFAVKSAGTTDYNMLTELPLMVGNEGRVAEAKRLTIGADQENTAYLEEPIHLRLDSLILGFEGDRLPVRDCTYVVMRGEDTRKELAGIFSGDRSTEGALTFDQGQVYPLIRRATPNPATAEVPEQYKLHQNYPNPFNPSTTIQYDLPQKTRVRIEVYNVLGQRVRTLIDRTQPAGQHQISFKANGLASGVYFYRIRAGSFTETHKMVLVK